MICSSVEFLLDLNDDLISNIFNLVTFNFRLINKQCKALCEIYNLAQKIFIFQSIGILKLALRNDYKIKSFYKYYLKTKNDVAI